MTVFIIQKPKVSSSGITYDVSPAQEYGEIKFIFDAYENPSTNPLASLNKIRTALNDFDPETDYCVSAGGDPYGLFLFGFVVNELQLPLKWLRFERLRVRPPVGAPTGTTSNGSAGYYLPVEMPVDGYTDA